MIPAASPSLSRRRFLGAAGGAALTGLLAACSSGSSTSAGLAIYSWADYFAQANLDAFAKSSGVTPKITTYDSNDTLFAKLNSSAGSGFDLVVPSSGWIRQYADRGLIQKIDHGRLNLSALDPALLNRDYDPGNQYSIPKDWGVYGVIYDPAAVGGEIRTWQDFLEAAQRPAVKGRVRLGESGWETVGIALWADGKDWNTTDQSVIKAAGDRLAGWVPKVKPQFSGFDVDQLASGAVVLAAHNQSGARRAIAQNPKLKWVVPGPTSELWVDSYAIPKDAPHLDTVYQFLSRQLTPEAQVTDTKFLGYPTALAGLRGKLPAGTADADLIFGGAGVDLTKLTTFVVNPDTITVYQDIQTQLQALA
ncbi:ABC transporter substrate-binding protein [Amycolatopsis ultiminotia]|uniref:ABC transporter substrate-binding protein n=1 Tax=Amycolatopsis ultiminotia TaxID=543629 RepID=A0ABP6WAY1_9PSEU